MDDEHIEIDCHFENCKLLRIEICIKSSFPLTICKVFINSLVQSRFPALYLFLNNCQSNLYHSIYPCKALLFQFISHLQSYHTIFAMNPIVLLQICKPSCIIQLLSGAWHVRVFFKLLSPCMLSLTLTFIWIQVPTHTQLSKW